MRWTSILTSSALCLGLCLGASLAHAQAGTALQDPPRPSDDVFLQLRQAFWRGDSARLAALMPQARGHALEVWPAYWSIKLRLEDASEDEVLDFLQRYPDTYQEDRLRNDWLLLTGKRREWAAFARELPRFRMQDDPEVRCYKVAMDALHDAAISATDVARVRADWLRQRTEGDGCLAGG